MLRKVITRSVHNNQRAAVRRTRSIATYLNMRDHSSSEEHSTTSQSMMQRALSAKLCEASMYGKIEEMTPLIRQVDVNISSKEHDNNRRPLPFAVAQDKSKAALLLLMNGAKCLPYEVGIAKARNHNETLAILSLVTSRCELKGTQELYQFWNITTMLDQQERDWFFERLISKAIQNGEAKQLEELMKESDYTHQLIYNSEYSTILLEAAPLILPHTKQFPRISSAISMVIERFPAAHWLNVGIPEEVVQAYHPVWKDDLLEFRWSRASQYFTG